MIIDFTNVLYMNWLLVIHFYLMIMSIFKLFYAPVKIIFLYMYIASIKRNLLSHACLSVVIVAF